MKFEQGNFLHIAIYESLLRKMRMRKQFKNPHRIVAQRSLLAAAIVAALGHAPAWTQDRTNAVPGEQSNVVPFELGIQGDSYALSSDFAPTATEDGGARNNS